MATAERDTAVEAVAGYWEDFSDVAAVALEDAPQLREVLGMQEAGSWWTGGRVAANRRALAATMTSRSTFAVYLPAAVMRPFTLFTVYLFVAAGASWAQGVPVAGGLAGMSMNSEMVGARRASVEGDYADISTGPTGVPLNGSSSAHEIFISAVAVGPDGTVYAGGSFFRSAGGGRLSYIARRGAGAVTWEPLGFGPGNGVDRTVRAVAVAPDGSVYVGGDFRQAGGQTANRVARWVPATGLWEPLGTGAANGVNGNVSDLDVAADGSVYVGGVFTQAGGIAANRVARWRPQTGTWEALGSGTLNGVEGAVSGVAAAADGSVYVGGVFSAAGGTAANNVARWNPQPGLWEPLGVGAANGVAGITYGAGVYDLEVAADGILYVGGRFDQAGGAAARSVARWDPMSGSWSSLGTGAANGVNRDVTALAVSSDGSVYIGGNFEQAGGGSANNVARWMTQTGTWGTLGSGARNGVQHGTVSDLEVTPDGRVYAGGTFETADLTAAEYVASWDPASGEWSALGSSVNAGTNAVAVGSDGSVYIGGSFSAAGGVAASRVARRDPTTRLWEALGSGVDGKVIALAVAPDGSVYVGGSFTWAGDGPARFLARWISSTRTWESLGVGVENGLNGSVYAIAVAGDGSVYVGGVFTEAGGKPASKVARWMPETATWEALGSGTANGVNEVVRALAVGPNGIYVGGEFTAASGVAANRVARWVPETGGWVALGTGTANGVDRAVYALAAAEDGSVYVGGFFRQAGGHPSRYIARWLSASETWEPLMMNADDGLGYLVSTLTAGGGRVYAGGDFRLAGGSHVAQWDGAGWSGLGTGPDDYVSGLALNPDGDLVLVGGFQFAGSVTSPNVMLYDVPRPVAGDGAASTQSAIALDVRPNPVSAGGTVRVTLAEAGPVRVAVYDVLGRQVAVLVDGAWSAGEHVVGLGAEGLVPGVYVVRVTAGAASAVRRVTVAR